MAFFLISFLVPLELDVSQRQTISLEEVIVEDDPSSLNQFLDE